MNSGGVTTKIRHKLEFHDEQRWKQFSARRLKLIEEHQLYTKKASDQDREVKGIAESLRAEFELSAEHLNDVDKLVRAAIQSIRRNRKRSTKSRKSRDNKFIVVSSTFSEQKQKRRSKRRDGCGSEVSRESSVSNESRSEDGGDGSDSFIADIMNVESLGAGDAGETGLVYDKQKKIGPNDVSKMAISSFIRPVIDSGTERCFRLVGDSSVRLRSCEAKKCLLNMIKRSRTCALSTQTSLIVSRDSNAYHLGKTAVAAFVACFLSKCFPHQDHQLSSVDYLRVRLNSPETLAKILKALDYESPDVKLMADQVAVNTLYYLLGCCVVDFGFDAILELVGCIFYEIIADDFPLIFRDRNFKVTDLRNDHLSNPDLDLVKTVQIRFKNRHLDLRYDSRVAAYPTLLEVLVNCKNAFNIGINSRALSLRSGHSILTTDFDLESVFKKNKNIVLDLCFSNDIQPINNCLNSKLVHKSPSSLSSEMTNSLSSEITNPTNPTNSTNCSSFNTSNFTLENPYQITSIQSYARSSSRKSAPRHIPPRFERLL